MPLFKQADTRLFKYQCFSVITKLQNLEFLLFPKKSEKSLIQRLFFLRKEIVLVQETSLCCQYKNDIFKNI